jgi:hypothetical protein
LGESGSAFELFLEFAPLVSKELVIGNLKRRCDGNIRGLQEGGDLQDRATWLCWIVNARLLRGGWLSWVVCCENVLEFAAWALNWAIYGEEVRDRLSNVGISTRSLSA